MTINDPASTPVEASSDNALPDLFDGSVDNVNVLEALVGPGKKFDSAEALARGKLQSDLFIQRVTGENKDLRAAVQDLSGKVGVGTEVKELLERLITSTAAPSATPSPTVARTASDAGTQAESNRIGLTREDVVNLLNESDRNRVAAANRNEANRRLHEAFGDTAGTVLQNKARDLGLSTDKLKALAETSPRAFYAMLGLDNKSPPASAIRAGGSGRGNVNTTTGMPSNPSGLRGKKHYDALKTQVGIRKFVLDHNIQLQLHKDMELLGDEFDNH